MKKLLLVLSLASLLGTFKATAQETSLEVYDNAIFYNMYMDGMVSEPVPAGAQRNHNTSYSKKLTSDQIDTFGDKLTLNVQAASMCDNYDRIGSVALAFVPKGSTSYNWKAVRKIELARFITPFMLPRQSLEVPYTFDITNVLDILHNPALTADFDFWVEFQIEGYQGGPGQGGAAEMYPSLCANRQDIYRGSLQFVSSGTYTAKDTYFKELSYRYELKNHTLDGTDVIGQTVKSITFNVDKAIKNVKYYIITSNHGSLTKNNQAVGEEYNRRTHYIYNDGVEKLNYKPGGKTCEPFRQYNTQPNGIYGNSRSLASWVATNNWCPGDVVPIRTADLGALSAGDHTFKINVPDAVFVDKDGYFPMSVYVQGEYGTLGTDAFSVQNFSISPNPVNDIATITSNGLTVKNVSVVNTLGQVVLTAKADKVDLSSLQSGVYIVKVLFDNNQTATQKIIKK